MALLELFEEDLGETRLLVLVGEVDAKSARDLQKKLLGWVAEGHRGFLIDCSRLEGIAGAGLRVLAATAERLEPAGGALALCSVQAAVRKVLQVAGMDRTLNLHADREDAGRWLRETVRRDRIALLATRLLRQADKQPSHRGPASVDKRRMELAVRLLSKKGGGDDPGDATNA